MSSYEEQNKKKLIRRMDTKLYISKHEEVVEVASVLGLKASKILAFDPESEEERRKIKKLIRRIQNALYNSSVEKVVEGAEIIHVKIPPIFKPKVSTSGS